MEAKRKEQLPKYRKRKYKQESSIKQIKIQNNDENGYIKEELKDSKDYTFYKNPGIRNIVDKKREYKAKKSRKNRYSNNNMDLNINNNINPLFDDNNSNINSSKSSNIKREIIKIENHSLEKREY